MTFISTPQGVEAKLIMSQNAVPVVNVWNFDVGHAVTLGDLTGVFAVVDAFVTSDLRGLMHISVTYDQIIVTDISVPNGQQIIMTPTSPNGLNTGVAAGANVAFVASLRTVHTGRSYRGRTYMAGLTASVLSDAQHTSTVYAAAVNTAFVNFINAVTTAGYKLCVLSRYLNNALRVAGLLTEIISVITDTKIDSQRRRTAN